MVVKFLATLELCFVSSILTRVHQRPDINDFAAVWLSSMTTTHDQIYRLIIVIICRLSRCSVWILHRKIYCWKGLKNCWHDGNVGDRIFSWCVNLNKNYGLSGFRTPPLVFRFDLSRFSAFPAFGVDSIRIQCSFAMIPKDPLLIEKILESASGILFQAWLQERKTVGCRNFATKPFLPRRLKTGRFLDLTDCMDGELK